MHPCARSYYTANAELVMQHRMVVRHYVRTRLPLDILTTLPWDVIILTIMHLEGVDSTTTQWV